MMSSYTGLLESQYSSVLDNRARGYMHHITDGARRMGEMIEAILLYSRIGHEKTVMVPVESATCLTDAMENLTARIAEAHATIIPGVIPPVLADRLQLIRLFQNLLSNAVKFRSDKRQLHIHVNAILVEQEWVFTVTDNGVGMEEANYGKIFKLFERLEVKRQVQGSGIGLATCKKIVEHHKGRIWVESKIDVGTSFFFSIPK
jgi:light-regulated signal transduction histidine kinase (bacteriophytochrome)